MLLVVLELQGASALGLVDGELHRLGDAVGIHDDLAVEVAGSTAGGLGEGAAAAQEALLVGVEDGHERDFGQVEALAQQVHAHEHIDGAGAQVVDDLYAVECLHIAVHVGTAYVESGEVVGEFFGHALGEGGDQGALVTLDAQLYLLDEVIDLALGGSDRDLGVEQAGGANDLLGDDALAALELIVGGRGAHIDGLARDGFELLEAQGAVIDSGLEPEAVVHKVDFARLVAAVHGAHLGHGDVALVDDGEEVLGQVVEQAEGAHAGFAAVEVARVVLDARAVAHLANHLEVVGDALVEPLGLGRAALAPEGLDLGAEVHFNLAQGMRQALLGGDEDVAGEDAEGVHGLAGGHLGERVEQLQALDLVAPEDDAQNERLLGQVHIDGVALDAEVAHA